MHRRTPLATLACLSMLTLAACGGGDADPADYPESTTSPSSCPSPPAGRPTPSPA